jgi:hypothetical protein
MEAGTLGKQFGFCIRCGATLTDPVSVAQGLGPVCVTVTGGPGSDPHQQRAPVDTGALGTSGGLMAKKNQPSWQMNGTPEPPIVNGYWDYGTVFHADWPRRRFHWHRELSRQTYWALWSYYYWGKKVRTGMRYALIDAWGVLRGRPWPPASPSEVKNPAQR